MSETIVVQNLPVLLNLGEGNGIKNRIGISDIWTDDDTGKTRIEIRLDQETSKALGDLVEVFELKGIGFAGVKRTPVDG